MSLSIIIPAYNESNQINHTIKKLEIIPKKIKDYEIIFIDDLSIDDTYKKLKKIEKKFKRIKVLRNKKKGLGPALELGIQKSRKEHICIFMCDLSDDVRDIIKYYKCVINDPNLDAVFGTRFSKDSKILNYPYVKLLINRIANNFIRFLFLSDYNDFTNAFKLYKRKTLLKLFPIVSENFNVFLELPLKIITRKYKYKIVSINWFGRKFGESKFRIKEIGSMYIFTMLYCFLEKILLNKK
ncbi:glycosyltransferase family 2 protein [Pelagibacterales bacterium SAG-MED13]|nr:glycosyltransferase family 2 protein [Pelagibacterales bacterium SAG-MED13]